MGVVALGPGVYRIPTAGDFINSFAFIEADGSVTLVDTGTRFATKRIVNGLAAFGKHPRDVQRIILTHAHADHAGSAARLLPHTGADGADVHVDDAEYIRAGTAAPSTPSHPGSRARYERHPNALERLPHRRKPVSSISVRSAVRSSTIGYTSP